MKQKIRLSIALLSAAVVGASPITSYAAQVKVVQICPGGGYQVLSGADNGCVQQILDQLDGIIGNIGNNCPTAPETETPQTEAPQTEPPQTEAPQTEALCPQAPQTEAPCPQTPQTEAPQTEAPRPQTPQTEAPQTEAPRPQTPQTEAPQTEAPRPQTPQTETPQTETPQTETPQTTPPAAQEPETDAAALSYTEQIVELVNAERAKEGLSAVTLDTEITAAANIRAKEIVQQFSHTRPNGSNFSTVLKEAGISYRGAGENIAYGQKSAQEVMNAWMNSSGHRANVMNKSYTKIGVGFYQDARGVKYWSQLFVY